MGKLIFADGQELNVLQVEAGQAFYDNASRQVLTVYLLKDSAGLDGLDALLSARENLAKIKYVTKATEGIFDHYQLKMELSLKQVHTGTAEDGSELKEEQVVFKLGRLTPIELRLAELGIDVPGAGVQLVEENNAKRE